MREKSAISWKEAREEAARLRETAGSSDGDEDEEDPANSNAKSMTENPPQTQLVSQVCTKNSPTEI